MQKLGNNHSQSVNRVVSTNTAQVEGRKVRSLQQSSEDHPSKSKKITKIIHNTFVIYVDQNGQRRTILHQKLRDRKSKENTVNLVKIRRQTQQFNRKIQQQAQATILPKPKHLEPAADAQIGMPWTSPCFYQFPFLNQPNFMTL